MSSAKDRPITFTVGMEGRRRDFDHSEAHMYFKQLEKSPLTAPEKNFNFTLKD